MSQASQINWRAWNMDETNMNHKHDAIFVHAYAPRVVAIAAATGNNHNRRALENLDAFNLCKQYLHINEGIADEEFRASEVQKTLDQISTTTFLSQYKIDPKDIRLVHIFAFFQRTIYTQWDSRSYSARHVVRSWLIYERLNEITKGQASEKIVRLLNQPDKIAFRCAFALFGLFMDKADNNALPYIDIAGSTVEDEMGKRFDINLNELRIVVTRLVTDLANLRSWHNEVLKIPVSYQKYYPLPFYSTPLISSDGMNVPFSVMHNEHIYLCPCPYMLLAGASSFLFRLLEDNEEFITERNIKSDIGAATEQYLEKALEAIFGKERVWRPKENGEMSADYIVELDGHLLVIECKKTITDKFGRTLVNPVGQVKAWEKLTEALTQCSVTMSAEDRVAKSSKKRIAIILTPNNVMGEDGSFAFLSQKSGILKSLGVEQFEALSIDAFERIFIHHEWNEVAGRCVEEWQKFRDNPNITTFVPIQFMDFKTRREPKYPHIDGGFEDLFPGINMLAKLPAE